MAILKQRAGPINWVASSDVPMSRKTDSRDFIYPGSRLFKSPEIWIFYYPMTGYGTVCMPDGSDNAWGMLFESDFYIFPSGHNTKLGAAESAPEPFESNKISIFYLTRKGSGQASDSNSIPHALSESSGMQTVPYPVIG